jgi:cytochrome P450
LKEAEELAARIEQDTAQLASLKASTPPSDDLQQRIEDLQQRIESERKDLLQFIYEALRFRPMFPILTRYVPRETVIANDTADVRLVPAGATMLAPPIAAMFDPQEFPSPWRFRPTRCLSKYVHFGFGPRLCFGQYIADVLMVEMFRALLLCRGLRRAAGSNGRVAYDGPVARSLILTLP